MASKQQFLTEKLSKFNSALCSDSLIECNIKHIGRKFLQAAFTLPQQPNGALQNYAYARGYKTHNLFHNTSYEMKINSRSYINVTKLFVKPNENVSKRNKIIQKRHRKEENFRNDKPSYSKYVWIKPGYIRDSMNKNEKTSSRSLEGRI